MTRIEIGDQAPALPLTSHEGDSFSLSDFRGKNAVVLFFYPKDGTPICTKEACGFRDHFEELTDAGAIVIGVSSDSAERHQRFAEKHHLPFRLVTDEDGSVRKAFGVHKTMGVFPGRVTYVIDHEGIVRHIFSSQMAAEKHVQEALTVLRSLPQPTGTGVE